MTRTLLTLGLLLAAPAAHAGLEICNQTSERTSVAVGYSKDGVWTSEGWWNIAPNDCTTVVGGDLSKRYYYYHAYSNSSNWGSQKYYFCTERSVFTIAGDKDCSSRGYTQSEFNQLDVGSNTQYTLNLTSSSNPAPPMAEPEEDWGDFDPPGTHGEPFSISGILSHCDVYDVTMACEFHADGFRYVANSADPTPAIVLDDLLNYPENTPMTISGDMIFYEGNMAEITIREYEATGVDLWANYRAAMQGFWRSLDDPDYEVLVYGSIFEEMSQHIPTDTSMMEFSMSGCPGFPGEGPTLLLSSFNDPEEPRCLYIDDISNNLVLFPAGVMNDLRFYKVN